VLADLSHHGVARALPQAARQAQQLDADGVQLGHQLGLLRAHGLQVLRRGRRQRRLHQTQVDEQVPIKRYLRTQTKSRVENVVSIRCQSVRQRLSLFGLRTVVHA
jgi:hypothetical protein